MRQRHQFRPTSWDALEERMVLSHSSLLDPFGLYHSLAGAVLGTNKPAGPSVTVGALGDSYTDEYRFSPPATPDQAQARNWVEILGATHRVSFGHFSTKSLGEPRNSGYANNWARAGATSNDMVQFELPGLTGQVAKGQVKYVSIFIGGNDFAYFAESVAAGKIAPDQVQPTLARTEAQLEQNFTTAVNTLLAANPRVRLVVSTLPDITIQPIFHAALGTPQGQALAGAIGAAIQKYNALVTATANNPRVALVDLATSAAQLAQAGGTTGQIPYGVITINLAQTGDEYHHFFLADGIHVGTVVQGVIANDFINAIDRKFGAKVAPLSTRQIIQFASHVRPGTP